MNNKAIFNSNRYELFAKHLSFYKKLITFPIDSRKDYMPSSSFYFQDRKTANKIAFFLLIAVTLGLLIRLFIPNQNKGKEQNEICDKGIKISAFDSSKKLNVQDYKIYEVTNYPEGIIMKLKTVAAKFIYQDSSGVICLPLNSELNSQEYRKLIFVKDGYVYSSFYLRNDIQDTLLPVLNIANVN
jgi:hypothetical protein